MNTGNRIRNGLLASLALNVFLLGGVLGGAPVWWRWWQDSHRAQAQHGQPRGLRQAAAALPLPLRERLAAELDAARRDNRARVREARDGRRDVLQLLRADTLDSNAIDAALQRARAADMQVRTSLENTVVGFAATLTPEQRRTLADGLSRQGTFRPRPAVAKRSAQP
ncbi:MAG: periplasmic heavy metal sensor [Pseudoxanthomonas sp.]